MGNTRVKITAYIIAIAYSAALAASGLHLPGLATKLLAFLPTVIVVVFAAFDQWVWRWGVVGRLARRPVLRGTWTGELVSYRDDGSGQEAAHSPVTASLVITQTYTTIHLTLVTAESKSRSVAEVLQRNASGDFSIYYQYLNTPILGHRDRSPIHAGGCTIEFTGISPTNLSGEYWTARRTRGTFQMSLASRSTNIPSLPNPSATKEAGAA